MQYVLIVNPVAGNGFALNVLEKAEAVLQDRLLLLFNSYLTARQL